MTLSIQYDPVHSKVTFDVEEYSLNVKDTGIELWKEINGSWTKMWSK